MEEPRFIVDTNVGHLARKLRMLGYDTLFINPIDDAGLIKAARFQRRIIVSGDSRLFERKVIRAGEVQAFFVDTHHRPEDQLRLIMRMYGLEPHLPFIRCFNCNTLLTPKTRKEAKDRVPPFIYETVEEYDYCPLCDQFFWEGDHVKRMRKFIREL